MKYLTSRLLLIWAIYCCPVTVEAYTGHQLLNECLEIIDFSQTGQLSPSSSGGSYCLGMVNGMLALNTIYQSALGERALFCLPETSITNIAAAKLVVDYLESYPEQLHLDAGSLMFYAFLATYPC